MKILKIKIKKLRDRSNKKDKLMKWKIWYYIKNSKANKKNKPATKYYSYVLSLPKTINH